MRKSLLIVTAAVLLMCVASPSQAAGKYCLAFWRELGAWENDFYPSGEFGYYYLMVRVVDQNGTPLNGKQITTSTGGYLGTTGSDPAYPGFTIIPLIDINPDVKISDGANLSDVTPAFVESRPTRGGHYTWEVLFVYVPDSSTAPTFDVNWDGVLNSASGDVCYMDAPCTRSLVYWSTNPWKCCSDRTWDSPTVQTVGQTFVATADRIVAAKCIVHGGTGTFQVQGKIRQGGPNGPQIGPTKNSNSVQTNQYWWCMINWGINDVPVTPGETYYLEIRKANGNSFYHSYCANNYAGGNYYENGVSYPTRDMMGLVAQAWAGYGGKGRISGSVKTVIGAPLVHAVVTTSGGRSAQTDSSGRYTLFALPAGSYDVTARIEGYADVTLKQRAVAAGATKRTDFKMTPAANSLLNAGFENGGDPPYSWSVCSGYWKARKGGYATITRTGSYYGGDVQSNMLPNVLAYQVAPVQPGYEYKVGCWALMDSWDGTARSNEYPLNVYCRVGVDPTGGTDPNAASVTWTPQSYPYMEYGEVFLKQVATGPSMTMFLQAVSQEAKLWNKFMFDDTFVIRSTPAVIVDVEPAVSRITGTSADISWGTNVSADSLVDYGTTTSYGRSATDSAIVTAHSVRLTGLQPNTTYHFKVTSAANGYNTDSSGDYTFTTFRTGSIGSLKNTFGDGTQVALPAEVATIDSGIVPGAFYVEEQDRSSAIRVISGSTVYEGDEVTTVGTLGSLNGERVLMAADVYPGVSGGTPAVLVALPNRSLPACRGLAVKTWGWLLDKSDGWFTISDGTATPVKVIATGLAQPSTGQYVIVTGICAAGGTGETVIYARGPGYFMAM